MNEFPKPDQPVGRLSEEQAWARLASEKVGRLVTVVGERPEIYPVNYVVSDDKVYFRTGEGSKLSELTVHSAVAFQTDHIYEDTAWSVVVHGSAHVLRGFDDAARIDALGLTPWVPTPKFNYVEITATEVTVFQNNLVNN